MDRERGNGSPSRTATARGVVQRLYEVLRSNSTDARRAAVSRLTFLTMSNRGDDTPPAPPPAPASSPAVRVGRRRSPASGRSDAGRDTHPGPVDVRLHAGEHGHPADEHARPL